MKKHHSLKEGENPTFYSPGKGVYTIGKRYTKRSESVSSGWWLPFLLTILLFLVVGPVLFCFIVGFL